MYGIEFLRPLCESILRSLTTNLSFGTNNRQYSVCFQLVLFSTSFTYQIDLIKV